MCTSLYCKGGLSYIGCIRTSVLQLAIYLVWQSRRNLWVLVPPPITFGQIKYLYFNKGGGLCPPYKIFDIPTPLCCSQQIVLLKAIESKNPHLFWHIS